MSVLRHSTAHPRKNFIVLSIENHPALYRGRVMGVLINAEVETIEEALDYQTWAEYVLGEVSWIEERKLLREIYNTL